MRYVMLMIMCIKYFIINARILIWISNIVSGAETGDDQKVALYLNVLLIGRIINTILNLWYYLLMGLRYLITFLND